MATMATATPMDVVETTTTATTNGVAVSLEPDYVTHLVIPGQVIADGDGFLRGHGTYVVSGTDAGNNNNNHSGGGDNGRQRLVASVAGKVERVNKLISVVPVSSHFYQGHVGDLVVGRVLAVQATRWKVLIGSSVRSAALPLSGVHLKGGVQRVRTAEDAREMRQLYQEGDLVSAEVHNVHNDGTLVLHTRSLRYGKLENGCLVTVPPALMARRKNHFVHLLGMTVLLGMNGYIWIQRALPQAEQEANDQHPTNQGGEKLVEHQEKVKDQHALVPVLPDERQHIARLRNAIQILGTVHMMITQEHMERVYEQSLSIHVADMLHPDNIIHLTEKLRRQQ